MGALVRPTEEATASHGGMVRALAKSIAVELGMLQRLLDTVSLTGAQWLLVIVLSLLTPTFVGVDKALQRRRASSTKLPVAGAGAGAAL